MAMSCQLSVNVNKIAGVRNARSGHVPNLVKLAQLAVAAGAVGITVHPRPDGRHIRHTDVWEIRNAVSGELNIEGNPQDRTWCDLVTAVRPTQVTLVPDSPQQSTSDHGWDTRAHAQSLMQWVSQFKAVGCRVSIFVDPIVDMVAGAAAVGADRVELFTGPYAHQAVQDPTSAILPYQEAVAAALDLGMAINAGHDLDLHNLAYFYQSTPKISEVSIGHALISDALEWGISETVRRYLACLI